METILEILKTMGKVTAREVAARMKIEPSDALDMLREHEGLEQVSQVNGYWALVDNAPTTTKTTHRKTPAPKRLAEKTAELAGSKSQMTESSLAALLYDNGPQAPEQLAKLAGCTSRAVASILASAVGKGRVVREKHNNAYRYALPKMDVATVAPEITEPTQPAKDAVQEPVPQITPAAESEPVAAKKSTAEFMDSIPQLAACKSSLAPLTPKLIAGEIRKTKNRLVQLEKLRVTVRTQTRLQRSLGLL